MQTPMIGSWTVEVKDVRPFSIHGDQYFELHVVKTDQPGQLLAIRVPQHVLQEPKRDQTYTLTFLMGQVTAATPVEA